MKGEKASRKERMTVLSRRKEIFNGTHKDRVIGPRKYAILTKIVQRCEVMSKRGLNPNQVLKFLKINSNELWKYTTKQLTGIHGRIVEFERFN